MPELSERDRAWWVRPDDHLDDEDPIAFEKLNAVQRHIDVTQERKRSLLLYGAMYAGGAPPAGGGMAVDANVRTSSGNNRGNLSLNVSRSVVDAVKSRIFAKSEPHLSYLTEGGGPEKQDNALKLELGVEGAFYQQKARGKFVKQGLDGSVYGTGFLRIDVDWDCRQPRIQRYRPWEAKFDEGEALYGEPDEEDGPRSLYTERYIDKYRLIHLIQSRTLCSGLQDSPGWDDADVADKAFFVSKLDAAKDEDAELGYTPTSFRVRYREGFHRPSGRGANDGRYVISVENRTLVDRPWTPKHYDRPFPFTWYRWSEPIEGFYGQGLVELGAGIQAEINKLVREIQNGHHLIKGAWLVPKGSDVIASHINNDLSRIIKFNGLVPPTYVAPAIITPEVYQHLWNLVQKYYELAGINQQAAQAQKPAGLNSGEAQRVYADQQTETLIDKGKRFEDCVVAAGQLITDAAKELADKHAYEVRAQSDDGFETIDWRKLEDPDGYMLVAQATSSLPGTLAGRVELAQDLMKVGQIDSADLMEIIGLNGDMLQETKEKLASRRLVRKVVGRMLISGQPYEPTPFMNLAEASIIATNMLNLAEAKNLEAEVVPESHLQLARDFITKCNTLGKAAQPPAPQNVAPTGQALLAPGAAPAAMPGVQPQMQPPPAANGAPLQ